MKEAGVGFGVLCLLLILAVLRPHIREHFREQREQQQMEEIEQQIEAMGERLEALPDYPKYSYDQLEQYMPREEVEALLGGSGDLRGEGWEASPNGNVYATYFSYRNDDGSGFDLTYHDDLLIQKAPIGTLPEVSDQEILNAINGE